MKAALTRGLNHVVVLIQIPDPEATQAGYDSYQADMWSPLKEAFPGRVLVYARNDDVYVHSKILAVDDVWMTIGSQNMNYRSLTSDTEIAVALVDEKTITGPDGFEVGVAPFEFRTNLWAAALGVDVEKMRGMTLGDAISLWQDVNNAGRRVSEYNPVERSPFGRVTQAIVDADGRCASWIKSEEEKEEEDLAMLMKRTEGGWGGDISEIKKVKQK